MAEEVQIDYVLRSVHILTKSRTLLIGMQDSSVGRKRQLAWSTEQCSSIPWVYGRGAHLTRVLEPVLRERGS